MATVKHPSNPLPFTFVKAQHLGPLRYTHRLQVSDGNELHHKKREKIKVCAMANVAILRRQRLLIWGNWTKQIAGVGIAG